ncbi:hypothetical protein [Ketobacter sp.]
MSLNLEIAQGVRLQDIEEALVGVEYSTVLTEDLEYAARQVKQIQAQLQKIRGQACDC